MVDLVIDANSLFHTYAFGLGNGSSNFLSRPNDKTKMYSHLFTNLEELIRTIHPMGRVIFCFDGQYVWRKPFLLDFGIDYKGGRKDKPEKFNREGLYEMLGECYHTLKKYGYQTYKFDSLEADDLIGLITNVNIEKGISSVIYSADSDLNQLLRYDGKNYVVRYSNDVYHTHHSFNTVTPKEEDFGGIFSLEVNTMSGTSFESKIFSKSVLVDPIRSLFSKILSGDTSDNIPPVYRYQKGVQEVNFTELRANQIYDRFGFSELDLNGLVDEKPRLDLASKIVAETKTNEISKIREISDNILRNKKVIHLDHKDLRETIMRDGVADSISEEGKPFTPSDMMSIRKLFDVRNVNEADFI